jgi:hypothetical protein
MPKKMAAKPQIVPSPPKAFGADPPAPHLHAASRNRERRNHVTTLKNPFRKNLNENISDRISRDALQGEHCDCARRHFGVAKPYAIYDSNAWHRDS